MINGFGNRVREARGSMTQQQLADVLGVTMQYLQVVEYGKSLLSMDKLVLLCKATNKPPSFFLQDYLKTQKNDDNTAVRDKLNQLDVGQLNLLSAVLEAMIKNHDTGD